MGLAIAVAAAADASAPVNRAFATNRIGKPMLLLFGFQVRRANPQP